MIDNHPIYLDLEDAAFQVFDVAGLIPIGVDVAFALVARGATARLYDNDAKPFWVISPDELTAPTAMQAATSHTGREHDFDLDLG